jgi:hypothetical protein
MVLCDGTGKDTYHLASASVGNARNRCIIPWFTPILDSHMKVIPTVTVQNVFLVSGFGSRLQQQRRRSDVRPASPDTHVTCGDQGFRGNADCMVVLRIMTSCGLAVDS